MNRSHPPFASYSFSERGSAFFMILFAVALFAALSFAISSQTDSGKALTSEKISLSAGELVDVGNKMADTVGLLRLRGVKEDQISFENEIVDHYDNLSCTTDKCKVFSLNGGGRDWEKPAPELSKYDWAFTGNLAIQNMATDKADLVMILPDIPLSVCEKVNKMLSINTTPPVFNGVYADKFIGAYAAVPTTLNSTDIQAQKSGCIHLRTASGSALSPVTSNDYYAYYHVLEAR